MQWRSFALARTSDAIKNDRKTNAARSAFLISFGFEKHQDHNTKSVIRKPLSVRMAKRASIVLLLLLMLSAIAAAIYLLTVAGRIPVKIAVQPRARSAPFYVAVEQGFFQAEGLEVTLVPIDYAGPGIAMLMDEAVDFSVGAGVAVIHAATSGKDLSLLAAISSSDMHAGIVFAPGARNTDLPGKRIGFTPATTSELFLVSKMRLHGIDPSAITRVPLEPSQFAAAILENRVDAVSLWEPSLTELRKKLGPDARISGGHVSFFDYWLLFSKKRSGEATEKEKRMIRALLRATAFLQSRPADSLAILRKYIPVSQESWLGHYFDLQLDESVQYSLMGNARLMNIPVDQVEWASLFRSQPIQAVAPWALGVEHAVHRPSKTTRNDNPGK